MEEGRLEDRAERDCGFPSYANQAARYLPTNSSPDQAKADILGSTLALSNAVVSCRRYSSPSWNKAVTDV